MKKVIKLGAVVSILALAALAFESFGNKPATAQMISQVTYSTISEANITVSSQAATQIDPTQKMDRRAVMVQNIGLVDVWCSNSASVAVSTGFMLTHTSSTVTAGTAVPNMVVFPFTADLKLYCKANTTGTSVVHVAQIR